jgi:hypothetical protein
MKTTQQIAFILVPMLGASQIIWFYKEGKQGSQVKITQVKVSAHVITTKPMSHQM